MPLVQGIEKLFSFAPRKRVGKYNQYGQQQFGFSNYGDEDIKLYRVSNGDGTYGETEDIPAIQITGIYRSQVINGKRVYFRDPMYIPANPRTVAQQANRAKMADAVSAWQALTEEQKAPYNLRAKRKNMSGYNLCLREYLRTH